MKFLKFYRKSLYWIVIISLITFFVALYLGDNASMDSFLNAAGVAGFVAMFGQFFIAILQELSENKSFNVCMVAKDSAFSRSLYTGIEKRSSKIPNIVIDKQLFSDSVNENIRNFIDNDAFEYDGIILRAQEMTDDIYDGVIELMRKNIPVVCLDLYLTDYQVKKTDQKYLPYFVASDFKSGGELVSKIIKNHLMNSPNTEVLLCIGPSSKLSIKIRCMNLLMHLSDGGYINNCHILWLDDLNINNFCEKYEEYISSKTNSSTNNDLLIFTGNDTLLMDIIESTKTGRKELSSLNNSKVTYIGYDGIKYQEDNLYKVELKSDNYYTIDVQPELQGELSLSVLNDYFNDESKINIKNFVKPILIHNGNEVLENEICKKC